MEKLVSVCRVCRNENVQLIEKRELQEMYEKLTSPTTEVRPLSLCYICLAQLKASRRFMLMCQSAEEVSRKMLDQLRANVIVPICRYEVQKPILRNQSPLNQLSIAPVELTNIDSDIQNVHKIYIKEEDIDVKIEIDIEEDVKQEKWEEQSIQDLQETSNSIYLEHGIEECLDPGDDLLLNNINKNIKTEIEQESETVEERNGLDKDLQETSYSIDLEHGIEQCLDPGDDLLLNNIKTEIKQETETVEERNGLDKGDHMIKNLKLEFQCKFICEFCKRSFSEESNLTSHMHVHKNEAMINHAPTHTRQTPYGCNVCKKFFITKEQLTNHERFHDADRPYVCNVCNKGFQQKWRLNIHTRIHTGEKAHVCNVCNKGFPQKSYLTQHTRIHTSERPHVCNVCNKRFRHKRSLSVHARVHTGEKLYVCNVCNKGFQQKAYLTQHTRIHTSEIPHVCNVCNKKFRHKRSLTEHARVHTGEKLHVCNVCNMRFTQEGHLTMHTLLHTGEKPHVCNVCNKGFRYKCSLTLHTSIHTGEKPHVCNVCNKTFRLKRCLSVHTRLHTAV